MTPAGPPRARPQQRPSSGPAVPRCQGGLLNASPRVAGVVARPRAGGIVAGPRVARIVAHKRVGRIVACPW